MVRHEAKRRAFGGLLAVAGVGLFISACGQKELPPPPEPLDAQYGFRDVRFGQTPNQIPGMDLARPLFRDAASPDYIVYKRSDEGLRVYDVPLDDIRYTFFRNQLMEINLLWEPGSRSDPGAPPPLYHFLTNQFGPPDTQDLNVKRKEFRAIWDANLVRLTLVETPADGRIQGRGLATLVSKPLAAQKDAAMTQGKTHQKYGF